MEISTNVFCKVSCNFRFIEKITNTNLARHCAVAVTLSFVPILDCNIFIVKSGTDLVVLACCDQLVGLYVLPPARKRLGLSSVGSPAPTGNL